MHANWPSRFAFFIASLTITAALFVSAPCRAGVTREEVERSIRDGVRYLKEQQNKDGSWNDLDEKTRTGMTSLVTLALLTAGEKPKSPEIHKALEFLRKFGPDELGSTYAIGLQTMVYAAAEPERDQLRHRRQRQLAGTSPDPEGRSGPLARILELLGHEATATRRQLQHAICPAGLARRQRSRRPRQGDKCGSWPENTGKPPKSSMEAVPIRPKKAFPPPA